MVEQAGKGGAEEANRLAELIEKVMERGVQGNLDKLDLDLVDEARRKQIDQLQERACAAVKKFQPNIPQMPAEAQLNLLRAIELAKQLQAMQKPGKGKGPRKPHGGSGRQREHISQPVQLQASVEASARRSHLQHVGLTPRLSPAACFRVPCAFTLSF